MFGDIEATKLRSSLALFIEGGGGPFFAAALARWYDGAPDSALIEILDMTTAQAVE